MCVVYNVYTPCENLVHVMQYTFIPFFMLFPSPPYPTHHLLNPLVYFVVVCACLWWVTFTFFVWSWCRPHLSSFLHSLH